MIDGAYAKVQLNKTWNLGTTQFELVIQKTTTVICVPMLSNGVIVKREAELVEFSDIVSTNGFIS